VGTTGRRNSSCSCHRLFARVLRNRTGAGTLMLRVSLVAGPPIGPRSALQFGLVIDRDLQFVYLGQGVAVLTSNQKSGFTGNTYAGMVPGGRVELPTPAFSGPRSTGELPRHRSSQKIVRALKDRSKLEVGNRKFDVRAGKCRCTRCASSGNAADLNFPTSSLQLPHSISATDQFRASSPWPSGLRAAWCRREGPRCRLFP
jgi:hypothetical protein